MRINPARRYAFKFGADRPQAEDLWWENLLNTYRRFTQADVTDAVKAATTTKPA